MNGCITKLVLSKVTNLPIKDVDLMPNADEYASSNFSCWHSIRRFSFSHAEFSSFESMFLHISEMALCQLLHFCQLSKRIMRERAKRDVAVQFSLSFIAHRMVFRFYYHNSNKYHQLKKNVCQKKKDNNFSIERETRVFFVVSEWIFHLDRHQIFLWITWMGLTTVFLLLGLNLSGGWSSGDPGNSDRRRRELGLNEWFLLTGGGRLFSLVLTVDDDDVIDDFFVSCSFLEILDADVDDIVVCIEIFGVDVECLGFLLLDVGNDVFGAWLLPLRLHSHSVKNTVLWSRLLSLQFAPSALAWHSVFSKIATPRNAVWVSALVFSVVTVKVATPPPPLFPLLFPLVETAFEVPVRAGEPLLLATSLFVL